VRSAPPGVVAGPVRQNAIDASRKMGQRGVAILVKETKTNEAALSGHRPPGDTTKRNAGMLVAATTVLRKNEKEEKERKRLLVMSSAKQTGHQDGPKADDTQVALAVAKPKKKGKKEEVKEPKVVINRDLTVDVKKRAEVYFSNLNMIRRPPKVPDIIPVDIDYTRYEKRLPSVFFLLYQMIAEPIVELWMEYKHMLKTSEDPIIKAKKARLAEERREKGFYQTTLVPAVVDLRDTMSALYHFR
jgi:hypothetical protein